MSRLANKLASRFDYDNERRCAEHERQTEVTMESRDARASGGSRPVDGRDSLKNRPAGAGPL